MRKYLESKPLNNGLWTYDTIYHKGWIFSIREPVSVVTDSGTEMVPSTIIYKRSVEGSRTTPLFEGQFSKDIHEYGKASYYSDVKELSNYIINDPYGETHLFAVPMNDRNSGWKTFSSEEAFEKIIENGSQLSSILQRIRDFFSAIKFGLLGSYSLFMNTETSDIDVTVEGGENFHFVTTSLKDRIIQKELLLSPLPDWRQQKSIENYQRKFKIDVKKATYINNLRNRYITMNDKGEHFQVSFSGSSFIKGHYQFPKVLGSKKIKKVKVYGTLIDAKNSSSFPREYITCINGESISVVSMLWSLRSMAVEGDKLLILGTLREQNGSYFISLEDAGDIILPEI